MSIDSLHYERFDKLALDFPIVFHYNCLTKGNCFKKHWHEKMEFLYFKKGNGVVVCNTKKIPVNPGVLVVVNSNEMHYVESISDCLEYYCIIVDNLLFKALHMDICEEKYINPIYHNLIIFKNCVDNDERINECIDNIIDELDLKLMGFELSVKSYIFRLMVLLLRNHSYLQLPMKEYNTRMKNLNTINNILQYIEKNYNENITVEELSEIAKFSRYYFLRLFKKTTGKSLIDYINYVRVNKAEGMLLKSDKNITEIAFSCGFNDANYFSRIFKKYKGVSPSEGKERFSENRSSELTEDPEANRTEEHIETTYKDIHGGGCEFGSTG